MNSVEDTVRAATRAYGGIVREIRQLELTAAPAELASGAPHGRGSGGRPPRARPARSWLAPLAAAAAVLAIGISLVIVRGIPNGRAAPAAGSATPSSPAASTSPPGSGPLPAEVPEYYVALDNTQDKNSPYQAVVASTVTGARLATVSPPAGSTFAGVTAAADDRTFVLDATTCSQYAGSSLLCPRTWYLLRLYPGSASPARLTRLAIPPTASGIQVQGIALSPDGSELAVALQAGWSGPGAQIEKLSIYSVATGALLRTWIGPSGTISYPEQTYRLDSNSTVFWSADGRTLTFRNQANERILQISNLGQDLIAGSRLAWSYPGRGQVPGYQLACDNTPNAVGDGSALICGATGMPAATTHVVSKCSPMWDNAMGFLRYSAATGDLERALYIDQTTCTGEVTAEILWSSASGNTIIGWLNSASESDPTGPQRNWVGVVAGGTFTVIPFPLDGGVALPDAVAW
ncbi:hypothetical protein [Trebonia sp.]|uniref:hypothetical protein n=1 Tax=Trebonia sp. TaxID=2767075 RepID=UPI002610D1B2|nr:hypothetical protein [Trebonia sp.]